MEITITEWILRLIYPERCMVCDRLLPFPERGICRKCREKRLYLMGRKCFRCGKKLQGEELELCNDCKKGEHIYDHGIALYEYEEMADALYRMKYQNRPDLALQFGEEIAFFLGDEIRSFEAQAIIPVPLHPRKERKRGYNQALLLAQAVGKELEIPVLEDLVLRKRYTSPMKELNPQERRNNLKNAFHIRPNGVKLESVIIMDDIYTTGSTIDEISLVLRAAGVRKIYFVTLAIGAGV